MLHDAASERLEVRTPRGSRCSCGRVPRLDEQTRGRADRPPMLISPAHYLRLRSSVRRNVTYPLRRYWRQRRANVLYFGFWALLAFALVATVPWLQQMGEQIATKMVANTLPY